MRAKTIEFERFIDTRAVRNDRPELPEVQTVLEELFMLLEDYSPAWYTEEYRSRTLKALLCARRLTS